MSSKDDFAKWQRQIEELADHVERDVISNVRIFDHYKDMIKGASS